MDPSRGYQSYNGSSSTYGTTGYSGQSQNSYGTQSSSASGYYGQAYQDASDSRGSYYSQQPQTSSQQTYPMRQHMGYGGSSDASYQYGSGNYSSMAQQSYSAPGSGSRSTFRKRPRDDTSRFDEPRPKRQDTRSDRSGPSSSRWPRGGGRGGSSGRGTRGRGRGRGRGDDRGHRPSFGAPSHMSSNGRGSSRFGRGRGGRGGRGREAPSPSSRFYSSRDSGSRDYSYDDGPKSYDKDRRAPPPPRSRPRSPPTRSSPRPFPSRQMPESSRSSHRRSRTPSKSPSRQKDDVIKLFPQSVVFASGQPGDVEEHTPLSTYFSEHPGLHLAPELQVGMEDFLFKVSLMEVNKRKVRKRESAIAEAEIYKRDIIVCWLFSEGDFSNLWLPTSEFAKIEPPLDATESKDGETEAPPVDANGQAPPASETKEKEGEVAASAAVAPTVAVAATEEAKEDEDAMAVDKPEDNKTIDVVDTDAPATEVATKTDVNDEAPTDMANNNKETVESAADHQAQPHEQQESAPAADGEPAQAEDSSEPMDVDDSSDDVIVTGETKGNMDVDGKMEATENEPPKLSKFTVVFGIDHSLRADSESKMNHDFLPKETLDNTRVVIVSFGLDPMFGSDPDNKLSSAEDAKKVFERLLTTGPLKKQSFRGVPAWDLDPVAPRSFQVLYPKIHDTVVQFYHTEQENDQVEKLREDNTSLRSKNATLKKSLDSARAKVEKYEKLVEKMMNMCEEAKK